MTSDSRISSLKLSLRVKWSPPTSMLRVYNDAVQLASLSTGRRAVSNAIEEYCALLACVTFVRCIVHTPRHGLINVNVDRVQFVFSNPQVAGTDANYDSTCVVLRHHHNNLVCGTFHHFHVSMLPYCTCSRWTEHNSLRSTRRT